MKYPTTVGFSIGVLILLGAASVSGQTWGRPPEPRTGACFYEHNNFGGRYFCARVGAATAQVSPGMNNQISSIRVFGDAEVIVFREIGFAGQSRSFDTDMSDLRRVGWNDRISSFRVETRGSRGGGGENWGMSWGRPSVPRAGACFYRDINFGGQYFCAPVGATPTQVPPGMNDQISSIRVIGNAVVTVFREAGFQGQARSFDYDMSDLRRVGLNDRISSFRVEPRGSSDGAEADRGGNWEMAWGRPSVPRSGACFYRDINYGGQYFCAPVGATAAQVPVGMNDQISSIRVFGNAEVVVFRESGFQGQSGRFGSDINDLRIVKLNDRISSFRVGTRGSSYGRN
jgi:hypothetical protein